MTHRDQIKEAQREESAAAKDEGVKEAGRAVSPVEMVAQRNPAPVRLAFTSPVAPEVPFARAGTVVADPTRIPTQKNPADAA